MKKYKAEIATAFVIWFAIGFVMGLVETMSYRWDWEYEPGTGKHIDTSKSGCVYKSYAAFLSPGHISACELFRRRFEMEGFKK